MIAEAQETIKKLVTAVEALAVKVAASEKRKREKMEGDALLSEIAGTSAAAKTTGKIYTCTFNSLHLDILLYTI